MTGSAPDTLTDALNKEFEAAHPGVKVKYEIQQWDGIQQKLTTALAGGDPAGRDRDRQHADRRRSPRRTAC